MGLFLGLNVTTKGLSLIIKNPLGNLFSFLRCLQTCGLATFRYLCSDNPLRNYNQDTKLNPKHHFYIQLYSTPAPPLPERVPIAYQRLISLF
ncbi:JK_66P [Escherichia phage Jk06]|uniref:JK_66P n=1 Tax=Escherichia phage Jk06 TaxID=2886922 RepID=Q45PU9_9CAUD|nr:hypothetical protein JK_66 [Escherichia phage Jk06]AAZ29316.1 JK_66P [Escherichia phage Jk06]